MHSLVHITAAAVHKLHGSLHVSSCVGWLISFQQLCKLAYLTVLLQSKLAHFTSAAVQAGLLDSAAVVQAGSFHISNCASWLTLQRCCSLSWLISHQQLCKLAYFTALLKPKQAHFHISSCESWLTLQRCCCLSRLISNQ